MAEEKYNRKAVFVGRRILADGTIGQKFELLPKREPMLFSGIKHVWIGYTYKCLESKMPIRPEQTEDEKEENPAWEAEDALVTVHINKKRAEAKMKKLSTYNVDRAVEALRPLVKGLRFNGEKEALVKYLLERAK